jgi:hypothetical protein
MSAMGQKRKWCHARVMSALPLKTDIRHRVWHVRYVPEADSGDPLWVHGLVATLQQDLSNDSARLSE